MLIYLLDTLIYRCLCFAGKYPSEPPGPHQFHRIRLGILDFPERKTTKILAANCKAMKMKILFIFNLEINCVHTHLGIAQMPTNKFQLWNKNPSSLISISSGIIIQAIPAKIMSFSLKIKFENYMGRKCLTGQKPCIMIFLRLHLFLPGSAIIPIVQNISIQHKIFSRYFVG